MKRLVVVPVTVLTALLVLSFGSPATARSVVRSLGAHLQLTLGSPSSSAVFNNSAGSGRVDQLGPVDQSGSSAVRSAQPQAAPSPSSSEGSLNTAALLALLAGNSGGPSPVGHRIATYGHMNCGRYGNGFHGGKHVSICR